MSKYVVVATFESPKEHRAEFIEILREHGTYCVSNEPGTLAFDVLVPTEDDGSILIHEVYESREAFDTHWNSDRTQDGVKSANENGFFTGFSSVHCMRDD